MCGMAGVYLQEQSESASDQVEKMVSTLSHRGPDAKDTWTDIDVNLALGHARLSILDLSETGSQPMHSFSNRWSIVYNGEVYNFKELKLELQKVGIKFKGNSDTEVIVNLIDRLGVVKATEKLIGMFSIAVWDKHEKTIYLVRDRLGIKPLYWGRKNKNLFFSSELKALRQIDNWQTEIDRNSLVNYFRHNYIPAPYTIYKDVYKLLPGHILKYDLNSEPEIKPYWKLKRHLNEPILSTSEENEIIDKLHSILSDSITKRMIADVPLGAFLSGGIDSSIVTAIMQENSIKPVNTFSIGFSEVGYNEAKHAAAVARHLGTHHTELYITPKEAMDVIPLLSNMYDEPFSDSSQIPTYLVSKLARHHVTVSLSGDGGDECFAGYSRYFLAEKIDRIQRFTPKSARVMLKKLVHSIELGNIDHFSNFFPEKYRVSQLGHRVHKFADIINEDQSGFYRRLVSHWEYPEQLVRNGSEYKGLVWDNNLENDIPDFINRMCYMDLMTYLPDDILTKVDRASMAVSLEARVPLLDHRIVEFSQNIPLHMKIRNGKGKWILRQILYKYIPKELMERPKMGFGVPIDHWLRGPLRDWAESLLDEKKINEQGYLNYLPIKEKWDEHLSGKKNWQYHIWDVLMFQSWMNKW